MNSFNKHVPLLVFFLGMGLLIYAMRTFFHPGPPLPMPPISVDRNVPAPSPTKDVNTREEQKYVPRNDTATPWQEVIDYSKKRPAAELDAVARAQSIAVRDRHLKALKLKMNLPESWDYQEGVDGPIKVLTGVTSEGQDGFYMFSAKGNYTPDQAKDYVLKFLGDKVSLNPPEPGAKMDHSSPMKDVTMYKGTSPGGFAYRMIYFKDPGGTSHMVMVMDSEEGFARNSGLIRSTIDSIRTER